MSRARFFFATILVIGVMALWAASIVLGRWLGGRWARTPASRDALSKLIALLIFAAAVLLFLRVTAPA